MTSRWNKRRRVRTPVSYAVYYSDGQLHASGIMQDLTEHGGCVSARMWSPWECSSWCSSFVLRSVR